MGLPYSAITEPHGSRKRVRYEDEDNIQPARRLQRRNAVRELRHAHAETVPLLMRSLNLGTPSSSSARPQRPGTSTLAEHAIYLSNYRSNVDPELPLIQEQQWMNRNDSNSPGDSVDDDLRDLRHALWNSAGAPPASSSSASPSASPQIQVEQLIAPPRLTHTRRNLFSSSSRPFFPPRPASNGATTHPIRPYLSERARRAEAHSSIDSRGLSFDRLLGHQGSRPYTTYESRGSTNAFDREQLPDPPVGTAGVSDSVGRVVDPLRLRRTGAVASLRAARASSMAALLGESLERQRRETEDDDETQESHITHSDPTSESTEAGHRENTWQPSIRFRLTSRRTRTNPQGGNEDDSSTAERHTIERPRLDEADVPADDEEMAEED